MNITVDNSVKTALDMLNSLGFEAYIVGGCVRDSMLGNTPHDWDICTNAKPEQLLEVFKSCKTVTTGIKHGTVAVIIDGLFIEITTYRIDGEYTDGRHPDSVSFTPNLSEDLSRRDFTVNAMAYSEKTGLIDLFGGLDDLNNKIIRCVGNPDKRFNEDALRIARAVRFCSQLNFNIEQNTHNSIFKNKALLKSIAAERIRVELDKLLCGVNCIDALEGYREVIAVFLPQIKPMFGFEQKNPHHCYDVWQHTLVSIKNTEPVLELRLAMLFHDIGKPHCFTTDQKGTGHFYGHAKISLSIAEEAMRSLKYDNETISTVLALVKAHDSLVSPEPKAIKRWLNKTGEDNLRLLLKVKRADNMAQHPNYRDRVKTALQCEAILDEVIKQNECFRLKQLAVSGNDLIETGIPQGKKIGEYLNKLLQAVIDEKCKNNKEDLINYIKAGKI